MKIEVDPSIFLTYKAKDVQTRLSDNPMCIDVKEDPLTAAARLDKYSFDQAPVVEMGVVVGWILRTEIQGKERRPLRNITIESVALVVLIETVKGVKRRHC